MPDGNPELFREPDRRSGPAVLGRDPIVLTGPRKEAVRRAKNLLGP